MILSKLLGRRSKLATKHGPYRVSEVPGNFWSGSQSGEVDADRALSLSAVFAAANILSRIHGYLPVHVIRQVGRSREKAITHPAYRILHTRPNPEMSASVYRRVVEWNRLLFGGAYSQIIWAGNGKPAAVWPIEGWRIAPARRDDGTLYYLVDGKTELEAEDVLAVPGCTPDGTSCKSFVDYASESLGLGINAQQFASKLFHQGARPGGILKHAGHVQEKAREEMRESWERVHGGPDNAGKTAVIWGGWEYSGEDGSFAPEQAQLLQTRQFATEDVSRWFDGIPPHMIGDLSRATFSNIEEQGLNLVIYTLMPTYVQYEQEYDHKLLSPPYVYSKYNVDALARGNKAARATWYQTMFNTGAYSVNDILEKEDENPIEGGDVHWIPNNNLVPITQAIGGAAPVQTPAPAPAPQPAPAPEAPQMGASIEAKRDLFGSTLDRLSRVEANAMRRASEKPDSFLDWMEGFYPGHQEKLTEALRPVLAVVAPAADAVDLARAWCEESRKVVLRTSEATPARLAGAVDFELKLWGLRAQSVVHNIEVA